MIQYRIVTKCGECHGIWTKSPWSSILNWAKQPDGTPYHMCGHCGKYPIYYDCKEKLRPKTMSVFTWFKDVWDPIDD